MSVITQSSFAKLLWPGINAIYGNAYKDFPTEYDKIFPKYGSTKAYEEDLGLSSFGLAAVKPEGAPISYDSARQGFTTRYNHVVYALGFTITREMYEDNQYSEVSMRDAKALARSMRHTKEIVAANVLNRATTAGYTGGDGVVLLSTAHVNVSGDTTAVANKPSTDVDLSEAALEDAVITIAGFRDDRGLLIAAQPRKLIIGPSNQFEAKRILGTSKRVGTNNNDINVLNTEGIIPEVVVNHFLTTGTDDWFILTDVPDSLKYFERRGDEFNMDNDFDTENAKFKATSRYSFGWSDWRGIYGSTGA
jgi:hypothetical protein